MITLADYFGDKKEKYASDLTDMVRANATDLMARVNLLLTMYKKEDTSFQEHVNSGWRPASYNKTIKGAAPNSKHILGNAVDLRDVGNRLGNWLLSHQDALITCSLFMEHPSETPGWCHLQRLPPKSGSQVFMP